MYLLIALLFLLPASALADGAPPALSQAAEQGDAQAQYELGEMYFSGAIGGAPDYPTAAAYFLKAAEQGVGMAQLRLGFLYAEKHFPGMASDYEKAEYWFKKAAIQNAGDARFRLGNFYRNYVKPPDLNRAITWIRLAATGGHATAQYDLSVMLKNGDGAAVDMERALYWRKRAANNGVMAALVDLARKDGGDEWVLKIAERSDAPAYWLRRAGDIMLSQDRKDAAITYYKRAADKHDRAAQKKLEELNVD